MKLLIFNGQGGPTLGAVTANGVVALSGAGLAPGAVLQEGDAALARIRSAVDGSTAQPLAEADLELGPCVVQPGKIIAVGLNYRRHAQETGAAIPETPILFSKFNNTLAASGDQVPLPRVATQYDYEVELGVV